MRLTTLRLTEQLRPIPINKMFLSVITTTAIIFSTPISAACNNKLSATECSVQREINKALQNFSPVPYPPTPIAVSGHAEATMSITPTANGAITGSSFDYKAVYAKLELVTNYTGNLAFVCTGNWKYYMYLGSEAPDPVTHNVGATNTDITSTLVGLLASSLLLDTTTVNITTGMAGIPVSHLDTEFTTPGSPPPANRISTSTDTTGWSGSFFGYYSCAYDDPFTKQAATVYIPVSTSH